MTPKQQRFVDEYLIDLNATQAAIRAGYSANTAEAAGSRLLRNVKVAEAVTKARGELAERARLTADMVVEELRKIGFSDIRRLFSSGGSLLPVQDLDDEAAAAISSIEVVTKRVPGGEEAEVEHTAKLKLWDKRAALESLGKHFGIFTDKVEHSGGVHVTINKPGA